MFAEKCFNGHAELSCGNSAEKFLPEEQTVFSQRQKSKIFYNFYDKH